MQGKPLELVFEADVSIAQMMDLRAAIRDGERWSAQDAAFHVCLAECSKNPLVDKMVAAYSDTMRKYLDAMVDSNTTRDMEQHIQEHERILGALRARDKAVMRASVRNHLESTREHLLRLVDENTAIQFINRR